MRLTRITVAAGVLLVVASAGMGVAAAGHCDGDSPNCHDNDDGDSGGGGVIDVDIDFSSIVDKLEDLLNFLTGSGDGSLSDILTETLLGVFFHPIQQLVDAVVGLVAGLITWYPAIEGNPDVEAVHRVSLQIAALLTVIVFAVAAVMHIVQDWLSFTPSPALWKVVPRTFAALALSTISLPFMQHLVDGTVIIAQLFLPSDVSTLAGLSVTGGLILAGLVNAVLLVLAALLYVLKGVFVMYVAGISPLVLLAWATPWTRKYAGVFVQGFTTALLVAPLSAAAFRLTIGLLEVESVTAVPDWLLASAMLILLLAVPWMMWSASGHMLFHAGRLAGVTRRKVVREVQESDRFNVDYPLMRVDSRRYGSWNNDDWDDEYGDRSAGGEWR